MKLRIPINLANEPFQRTRPMLVASAVAGVLLLGLLALLISLSTLEKGQAANMRQTIGRLESQSQSLSGEQARLEAVLRRPENAAVLERSLFLNSLIYAKGISWTRLFDDLEKVLPHNVRIIQVRPHVNAQNEISLDMVVGADSSGPVIQFLTRLENAPQFGTTLIHKQTPPSQSEPLWRYQVSVNYAQKL